MSKQEVFVNTRGRNPHVQFGGPYLLPGLVSVFWISLVFKKKKISTHEKSLPKMIKKKSLFSCHSWETALSTRWKCLFLPQHAAKNNIFRLPFVTKCELDGKQCVSLRNKVATTLVTWQGAAVWRDYVHFVGTVRLNVSKKNVFITADC